jgi:hypothetical protein
LVGQQRDDPGRDELIAISVAVLHQRSLSIYRAICAHVGAIEVEKVVVAQRHRSAFDPCG